MIRDMVKGFVVVLTICILFPQLSAIHAFVIGVCFYIFEKCGRPNVGIVGIEKK